VTARAVLVVKINDALVDPRYINQIPPPPDPWFVRGPRGGLYVATGEIRKRGPDWMGDDFMRGVQSIVFESEGVRYVRPGSRLAKQGENTTP
jgi:hypothetical protein